MGDDDTFSALYFNGNTGIHIYWASKEYCEKDTVKKINRLADGSYMVIVDTIRSCAVGVVDRQ